MPRKTLSIAILAVVLAACGGGSSAPTATPSPTPEPTPVVTPSPTPEPTPSPTPTAKPTPTPEPTPTPAPTTSAFDAFAAHVASASQEISEAMGSGDMGGLRDKLEAEVVWLEANPADTCYLTSHSLYSTGVSFYVAALDSIEEGDTDVAMALAGNGNDALDSAVSAIADDADNC